MRKTDRHTETRHEYGSLVNGVISGLETWAVYSDAETNEVLAEIIVPVVSTTNSE